MTTIAYLGPEHTNTHLAARKRFGRRATYVHAPTVDDVFQFVERREADYGVVPIENSLEGAVTRTLDRFLDSKQTPVQIVGEIERSIQHYLILRPGLALDKVRTVYSHPQALAQCRYWLDQVELPGLRFMHETDSTSEAVRLVRSDPTGAAIGRKEAADQFKLRAIRVEDERDNKTRFLVLGLQNPARSRRNKTSILMALKDRPGALYDALMPFRREKINLTKIESRPSKQKAWEYYFFIDVEGHQLEPRLKRALAGLKKSTSVLRVLGSYPIAK